jgi:hypothetical protein
VNDGTKQSGNAGASALNVIHTTASDRAGVAANESVNKMQTPQLPPLAGMTPLGLKPQTDSTTARPWKVTSDLNLAGYMEVFVSDGENFVASCGNSKSSMPGGFARCEANAALIIQAVNSYNPELTAALVAVSEAARNLPQSVLVHLESIGCDGNSMELTNALANLAKLREGKAQS